MARPPRNLPNLGTLVLSQQNFDMLRENTVALQEQVKTFEASDAAKARQITTLNTQLGEQRTQLTTLNTQLNEQKTQVTRLDRELGEQKTEAQRLNQELGQQKSQVTQLTQTLNQERGKTLNLTERLTLSDSKIAEFEAVLKRREAELESLRAQQSAGDKAQTEVNATQPIALSALARTIGDQATSASDDMTAKGMRISNLSVTLRALPTEDGTTLRLPGARALDNKALGERLAEFRFDIEMAPPATQPVAANKVAMPDLTGMTRSAAAQVMAALGLRMVEVSGPSNRPRIVAGQAFRQQVKPGDPVDRGAEIIVVFATG